MYPCMYVFKPPRILTPISFSSSYKPPSSFPCFSILSTLAEPCTTAKMNSELPVMFTLLTFDFVPKIEMDSIYYEA